MEDQPEPAYFCNACTCEILPSRDARINCVPCEDYDLCWDCHSNERISGMHELWHEQRIFRPAPLQYPIIRTIEVAHPSTYGSYGSPDPYWGRMVTPLRTASDLFCRLAHAIYTYVDQTVEPRGTTWLEPEKCSYVTDLLGYTPEENTFRAIYHISQQNGGGIAWSDEEVALTYEHYGWDHRMVTRAFQHQHESDPVLDGMPLLTRNGFVAMLLNDALVDPDNFYIRINELLRKIPPLVDPLTGEYFLRRDVPRSCWPSFPDEGTVSRDCLIQNERAKRVEEEENQEIEEQRAEREAQNQEMMEVFRNIGLFQGIGYPPRPRGKDEKASCTDGQFYYQKEFTGNLRGLER